MVVSSQYDLTHSQLVHCVTPQGRTQLQACVCWSNCYVL
jgi:hypothetical protein